MYKLLLTHMEQLAVGGHNSSMFTWEYFILAISWHLFKYLNSLADSGGVSNRVVTFTGHKDSDKTDLG